MLAESGRPWEWAWGEDEKTRMRMESNVDAPNINQKDFAGVARIQLVQDEVQERSMGLVEGVGEGIVVSKKRSGYVSGDPVGEMRHKGSRDRSIGEGIGNILDYAEHSVGVEVLDG